MKEPILSREEVLDALTVPGLNVEAALEPREVGLLCGAIIDLVEKLCGEPIYQLRTGCGHRLDCGKGAYEIARDDGCRSENCRIVYALNRSKA